MINSSTIDLNAPARMNRLSARLLSEMTTEWASGKRPRVEDYLKRFPLLGNQPEEVLELIYEEFCLREEYEPPVAAAEYFERFPQWQDGLRKLLDCHRLLCHDDDALEFPAPMSSLRDFTVVAELGRGGQGRVYLATQQSLENRPVVLKVFPQHGIEHRTLARLQHTHIMPLFGAFEESEKNTRVMFTPYLGGASLDVVFAELADIPVRRRHGKDIVKMLDRLQSAAPIQLPARGTARKFLSQATYTQAVCWIGACLAEALHFAHERGLVHLDVKPGNVLLAADGQPLLLDFHITQAPIGVGANVPDGFGATPAFMSPEQARVLEAAKVGEPSPAIVDHRSDIYSLGLVLCAACSDSTGQGEESVPNELSSLPISTGLRDILAKCLNADAKKRYSSSQALAEDLRRHVKDLPLQGVANRNPIERWRKWRRRRPAALPVAIMASAVLMAAAALGLIAWQHRTNASTEAELALHNGRRQMVASNYAGAVDSLQRGLQQAGVLGDKALLVQSLQQELHRARRAHLAEKLHALADTFRFAYGIGMDGAQPDDKSVRLWREVWENRDGLLKNKAGGLPRATEQRLVDDYLDLVLIWSELLLQRTGTGDRRTTKEQVFALIGEAEISLGSSLLLDQRRSELAKSLGIAGVHADTKSRAPRTVWEHCVVGRRHLNAGRFEEADRHLQKAVEIQPANFWAHFYQGVCAYHRKNYHEADGAFRACTALSPNSAECHANRALVQKKLGNATAASHLFDQALNLKPNLALAAFHRGLLHSEQKNYNSALNDLDRALQNGWAPASVWYRKAVIHLAQRHRSAAFNAISRALQANPELQEARLLYKQLDKAH